MEVFCFKTSWCRPWVELVWLTLWFDNRRRCVPSLLFFSTWSSSSFHLPISFLLLSRIVSPFQTLSTDHDPPLLIMFRSFDSLPWISWWTCHIHLPPIRVSHIVLPDRHPLILTLHNMFNACGFRRCSHRSTQWSSHVSHPAEMLLWQN